jgi:hypothetical protein
MKNILHFIKYNNAMTMVIALVFLGGGSVFAASPEVREATNNALIGKTETLVSTGNTVILNLDTNTFDPKVVVTTATEDTEADHISYTFDSFDVADGAWGNVKKTGELTVSKNSLGNITLLDYVEKQLGEVSRKEIAFLKEVKENEEKKGAAKTMVAVAYTGLLGLVIGPEIKEPSPSPAASENEVTYTPPVVATIDTEKKTTLLDEINSLKARMDALDGKSSPTPISCTLPEVLNAGGTACVTPELECATDETLTDGKCEKNTPPPAEEPTCSETQTLTDGKCVDNPPEVTTCDLTANTMIGDVCTPCDLSGNTIESGVCTLKPESPPTCAEGQTPDVDACIAPSP